MFYLIRVLGSVVLKIIKPKNRKTVMFLSCGYLRPILTKHQFAPWFNKNPKTEFTLELRKSMVKSAL